MRAIEKNISDVHKVELEVVACDMCGYTPAELVREEKNIAITRKGAGSRVDVNVSICPNCGLVFLSPRMTSKEINLYYKNQLRRFAACERKNFSENGRLEQAAYLLKKYKASNKLPGRIMDVGSFDGLFLSYFQNNGWEVVGVEPDEESAEFARNEYGQKIITSNFEDVKSGETGRFDIISMSHVLEHIEHPKEFLHKARSLLNKDGYLFMQVPDMSNPFISPFYSFFSFQHLYYYTPVSIASILKKGCFRTLEITSLPYAAIRIFANLSGKPYDLSDFSNHLEYERSKAVIKQWEKDRDIETERLKAYLNNIFKCAEARKQKIAIYGAGYHTQSISAVIGKWPACVIAIAEDHSVKLGYSDAGLPVVSLSELKEMGVDMIIISSYTYQEMMARKAEAYGFKNVIKLYKNAMAYDGLL